MILHNIHMKNTVNWVLKLFKTQLKLLIPQQVTNGHAISMFFQQVDLNGEILMGQSHVWDNFWQLKAL